MKMYEVRYEFNYCSGKEMETEQVTEDKLNSLKQYELEGKYVSNLSVIQELGELNLTWIPAWLKIGNTKSWIARACDPFFDEDSFAECKTVDYLIEKFKHGNWSIGTAFYYQDLCFINQVNGGDEWLTIRRDLSFESVSCDCIIKRDGEQAMKDLISRYLTATDEQLKTGSY